MSQRGRINQQVTDWRAQAPKPHKPEPDARDGVDLAVIIIASWAACFIAGFVAQRFFN